MVTRSRFSLNYSETVKAVALSFFSIQYHLIRNLPNLVFLTRPGLQILGKTQTGVFSISGFLVSPWHETWTSNLTWQEKKITSKKIWRWRHFGNCEVIANFSIYGKFGATRKLDSKRIVCKTYFFVMVTFCLTKTELKNL